MQAAPVLDPVVGIKQVCAELDQLLDADLTPASVADARDLIRAVEAASAKLAAVQVRVLDAVDASGVWADDGHLNGRTYVAHVGGLKPSTARARGRLSRALQLLPAVRRRFEAGELGLDAARRIASAMANPRARDGLAACDELIADQATAQRYDTFDGWMRDLVQAADPDGTRDRNQRTHERRDADLSQDFDGTWVLRGGLAALQGAELSEIWRHFVDAEFAADLDDARTRLGDRFTLDQLARTPGQRRADGLLAMARAAARTGVGADGSTIVTNVVMDQATYQRELARLAGGDVTERRPGEADGFVCRTVDGERLEPTEAVAAGLLSHVRRVVIGADSVAVDAGRTRRLFTGTARLAALLNHVTCAWPGCHRPASRCQVDHLTEWHDGGATDQRNAGPLCGRHNRHKHQHRVQARHGPDGTLTLHHPDGTEIG